MTDAVGPFLSGSRIGVDRLISLGYFVAKTSRDVECRQVSV